MRLNASLQPLINAGAYEGANSRFQQSNNSVEAEDGTIKWEMVSLLAEAAESYQAHYLAPHANTPSQFVSVWSPEAKNTTDCVVIGAGQTGISILALARALPGLRLSAIDKAGRGQESIWGQARCRMPTLRTNMDADVSLGLDALSMSRWWSTQTQQVVADDDKLPTDRVNDYLDYVRSACDLNENIDWQTELVDWKVAPDYVELHLKRTPAEACDGYAAGAQDSSNAIKIKTRAVILADGISGVSVPQIPPSFQALYAKRTPTSVDMRDGKQDTNGDISSDGIKQKPANESDVNARQTCVI